LVILGIDPGLASTGFGAIDCAPGAPVLSRCGSIRTAAHQHVSHRLFQIYQDLNNIMDGLQPEIVAVENVFSLVRYPKAGILLGGVIGVIYLLVYQKNIRVIEVTPREVKSALAGYGAATKVQIREATKRVLGLSGPKSFHAADALAVALTVFYRNYRGRDDIIPGRNTKKDIRR
jgi:crossover junction endodeoxyribonuclease RuvC